MKTLNPFPKFSLSVLLLAQCGLGAWAHPLDNWHTRYSGSKTLYGVTFGGGLFVVVGASGTILTSATGQSWAPQNAGTSAVLWDVAYGSGRFVAVGGGGLILTSPDGANWTAAASGVASTLCSVAYGNKLFVAAGQSGALLTSADGLAWASQVPGAPFSPNFLACGNGLFLLASYPGILLSADGTNWVQRPAGSIQGLYTVGFGRGLFVSVDTSDRSFISADGSNWVAGGSVPMFRPLQIACGNGHFVAAAGNRPAYSQNGTNWTSSPTGVLNATYDVAFGNGTFVAVAYSGLIEQSDPLVWLETSAPGSLDIFGITDATCSIESRDTLAPGSAWAPLTNFTLTNTPHRWTDPERSQHASRLYRVAIQP